MNLRAYGIVTFEPRLLRAFAIDGTPGLGKPGAPTEENEPDALVGGAARVSVAPPKALLLGLIADTGVVMFVVKKYTTRKTSVSLLKS